MAAERERLQDKFLRQVQQDRTPLTVFLINGVRLQGLVVAFDNFCVLLQRDDQAQLVYKHAISTVMPMGELALYEPPEEQAPAPQEQPQPVVVERKRRLPARDQLGS